MSQEHIHKLCLTTLWLPDGPLGPKNCTLIGKLATGIVQLGVGAFGLLSAGDQPRSSPPLMVDLELGQFSCFGMVAQEITCPFEVTGVYMPGTSFTVCIWLMTHWAGTVTFCEVKFHRQILTLLDPGLRSPYVLVVTTSLEKPCSLSHAITCTCLTWPVTLLTLATVCILKGTRVIPWEVVISPFTTDRLKTSSAVLPSANWPTVIVHTYMFLQASVSSLTFCSFTICNTFWITQVQICIGMLYVY